MGNSHGQNLFQDIPNKLYFRIGEVSDLVGVKPYVLRYWESEFPDIKPSKSKSGQRLYKRRDVEILLKIKELLYEERFTINGAKKRIKEMGRSDVPEQSDEVTELIEDGGASPKQLEAFPMARPDEPTESAEDRPLVAPGIPRVIEEKRMVHGLKDNSKVLIKIRKDLESILGLIRS